MSTNKALQQVASTTAVTIRTGSNELYHLSDVYRDLTRYTDLVILPVIGIIGLIGNTLSVVILIKSGLNKPSNILLLGLAVSDFSVLLFTINIGRLLVYNSPVEQYWFGDKISIITCYNLTMATLFIYDLACVMSTTLIVFITLERVIAVFFPLQFSSLVTPSRATYMVIFSFLIATPTAIIKLFKHFLLSGYNTPYGEWTGIVLQRNDWHGSNKEFYVKVVSYYILPFASTAIVTLGCIMIGVKVSVIMRRRKTLTSYKRNNNSLGRTKTLFIISFFFSISHIILLFTYLPELNYTSDIWNTLYFVRLIYWDCVEIIIVSNNAGNFFIYVISNPKFRKLIIQFLCRKNRRK